MGPWVSFVPFRLCIVSSSSLVGFQCKTPLSARLQQVLVSACGFSHISNSGSLTHFPSVIRPISGGRALWSTAPPLPAPDGLGVRCSAGEGIAVLHRVRCSFLSSPPRPAVADVREGRHRNESRQPCRNYHLPSVQGNTPHLGGKRECCVFLLGVLGNPAFPHFFQTSQGLY